MKKSDFQKEVIVGGVNGEFNGFVILKFNYAKKTKEVHNPSTHDEESRTFFVHRIEMIVSGKVIKSDEFRNESESAAFADAYEKNLTEVLKLMADEPKKNSIEEKLESKGYKKI